MRAYLPLSLSLSEPRPFPLALTALAPLATGARSLPRTAGLAQASLLDDLGEAEAADEGYRRATATWVALYGDDHPHVATARHNHGVLRYHAGDYAGARALVAGALKIRVERLGRADPDTLSSAKSLRVITNKLAELAKGEL